MSFKGNNLLLRCLLLTRAHTCVAITAVFLLRNFKLPTSHLVSFSVKSVQCHERIKPYFMGYNHLIFKVMIL